MRFLVIFLAVLVAVVSPMMGEGVVSEGTEIVLTVDVSEPTRINVNFGFKQSMDIDCGRDMMVVVTDDGIRTADFENPQTVWGKCLIMIRTKKYVNVGVYRLHMDSSSPGGWSLKGVKDPLFEKTFIGGRETAQSESRDALRVYIEADQRVASAYEALAAADKVLERAELKTYEALRSLTGGNKSATIEALKEERKAVEGVRAALRDLSWAQEASTAAAERIWAAAGKK